MKGCVVTDKQQEFERLRWGIEFHVMSHSSWLSQRYDDIYTNSPN